MFNAEYNETTMMGTHTHTDGCFVHFLSVALHARFVCCCGTQVIYLRGIPLPTSLQIEPVMAVLSMLTQYMGVALVISD